MLLLAYNEKLISYDLNKSKNPKSRYDKCDNFDLKRTSKIMCMRNLDLKIMISLDSRVCYKGLIK